MRKRDIALGGMIVFVILGAGLLAVPDVRTDCLTLWALLRAGDYAGLVSFVRSLGWGGAAVLFLLQFGQNLLPVFPEALLQITAGVAYGPWWGTLILMTSYTLSNLLMFMALRRFRPPVVDKLTHCGPLQSCQRWLDHGNPEAVVFFLYVFPFLSNGLIPYLASQTKISFRRYVAIMILACLPMMMVSVYLGDRLAEQDWTMAAVAFGIGVGVSVILYFSQQQVLKMLSCRPSSVGTTRVKGRGLPERSPKK